jgi:hypothetical protein
MAEFTELEAKDGVGLGSGLEELVEAPPQPASELTARMQTIHAARRGAATWGLSRTIIFSANGSFIAGHGRKTGAKYR